jgi:membrane protease YdiL (CAAX protease family)
MSICLAHALLVAAATTLPTVPSVAPAPPPDAGPPWLVAVLTGWAVVGLTAAWGLGAFRRRGIVGPERLGADDSAWTLLGLLCAGLFSLIVGTALVNTGVGLGLRLAHAHPDDDVRQLMVAAGGEALAVAVVLVLARETVAPNRTGLARLGLGLWRVPVALAGGATALFILFPLIQLAGEAVVQLYRAFHLPPIQPHQMLQMMDKDHGPALTVLAVLTAAVVAPVAEELAFRGLMQTMLARMFNRAADGLGLPLLVDGAAPSTTDPSAASPTRPVARWAAVLTTSVAFAAVHGEPAFLAPIFVLSVGLGFAYERSSNLWMPIVAHGLFNGAQIALFLCHAG